MELWALIVGSVSNCLGGSNQEKRELLPYSLLTCTGSDPCTSRSLYGNQFNQPHNKHLLSYYVPDTVTGTWKPAESETETNSLSSRSLCPGGVERKQTNLMFVINGMKNYTAGCGQQ